MALAVAMFVLGAIVIGWPWLSGRVTIPWDAKAHFQPQIQFLAQSLAQRRVAVLGALRVQRPSADRRPAVDDLLAAVPGAGAARRARRACGRSMPRCWRWCSRRRGLDAVVPRPGLALGRRADRGAGLQLRGVDGLAHPAHRPGAEPRLSADCAAVPRPGAGARLDPLRHCRRASLPPCIVLGRDQVALLAIYLLAAFGRLARAVGAASRARRVRASCCRSAAGARLRAGDRCRAGGADGAAGRRSRTAPSIDYVGAGARLAASGPAADRR